MEGLKVLHLKWASYIEPSNSKLEQCTAYNENNWARAIMSRFRSVIEFLPISLLKIVYKKRLKNRL